jgi:hypothetical protein
MKKTLSSQELSEAWMAGVLPLRTAARRHFKLIGIWPVDEKVMLSLEMILGFANVGMVDALVPVSDNEELTVGKILERYQLSDFLG